MARNMKEANKYIFNTLKAFMDDHPDFDNEIKYFGDHYIRYVETDKRERKYLKKLKVLISKSLTIHLKFAIFEYSCNDKRELYFVSTSLEEKDIVPSLLDDCGLLDYEEINAGIFTALIYELKMGIKDNVDPYEIFNTIFYEIPKDTFKGFAYDEISIFFEPLKIYEIKEDCPLIMLRNSDLAPEKYETFLFRLSLLLLAKSNSVNILQFNDKILEYFVQVCLEGNSKIPYENLLYSFLSFSWKHCFLDIYRCIERLFVIVGLKDFYEQLNSQNNSLDFNFFFECFSNISWKPREEDALKMLLENHNEITEDLKHLKNNSKNDFKFIYDLRNSIVHCRASQEIIIANDDDHQWNIIISVCLRLVLKLYAQYQAYL